MGIGPSIQALYEVFGQFYRHHRGMFYFITPTSTSVGSLSIGLAEHHWSCVESHFFVGFTVALLLRELMLFQYIFATKLFMTDKTGCVILWMTIEAKQPGAYHRARHAFPT